MPDRTLEDYQALWRDFERIDYLCDSTATSIYEKPFGYEQYVKEVWDAINKRFEVVSAAIENRAFERCEAYGFLSLYPPKKHEEELNDHFKQMEDIFSFGRIKLSNSDKTRVWGNHPLSFMNYSLEDMRGYLQQLARGEEISIRHKEALDTFLDECAEAGGCFIRAMDEELTTGKSLSNGTVTYIKKRMFSLT